MEGIQLFGRTISWAQLKYGLFGLSVVIFLGLFSNDGWPKFQSYLDLRGQVEQTEKELADAEALTATETQVRGRLARVKNNLSVLRGRFPPRNQILSELLVDLSRIFASSHNKLVSFQPRDFVPLTQESLKDLGKISIDITAKGSYPSIILLFDQLSRYERVLTVEAPTLTPGGQGAFGNELTVTFTLTTYALNQ